MKYNGFDKKYVMNMLYLKHIIEGVWRNPDILEKLERKLDKKEKREKQRWIDKNKKEKDRIKKKWDKYKYINDRHPH